MKTVGNNMHYCFTNAAFPCLRLPPFIFYACKMVTVETSMRFSISGSSEQLQARKILSTLV